MSDNNRKDNGEGSDFIGISGLLKGIERIFNLAGKIEQEETIHKEGKVSFDHLEKGVKGVYGLTIRTVTGGLPRVETFGNIRKTPEGPVVYDEREPLTDIFDEKEEVVIIMEMPGIEEEDIKINLKENIIEVVAINKNRKYRKKLVLPTMTADEYPTTKYNNGVLEIRIKNK